MSIQSDFQAEVEALRHLQSELQQGHRRRQQSQQQLHENEMVLQELQSLADDANVYKMIGPVLVRQDTLEARNNVTKRLEFITGELKRLDATLQQLNDKQGKKQNQLLQIQQRMQQQQAAAAGAGA